jgi:hypothetical protein
MHDMYNEIIYLCMLMRFLSASLHKKAIKFNKNFPHNGSNYRKRVALYRS